MAIKKELFKNPDWEIHPEVIIPDKFKIIKGDVIWKSMPTKHEGNILYWKLWNFWVRAGVLADTRSDHFFRDYEKTDEATDKLMHSVGFRWKKAETEQEVWRRIGLVWKWLKDNVQNNGTAYSSITSIPGTWPSILDFGKYYEQHNKLVWAACFSKAHLFATLLGRLVYPRYRFAIATGHHTQNGAPPTASHVFVAVYVAERWFYLDPTAVYSVSFPTFNNRKSIATPGFTSVDYEHPFKLIPVPLSGLAEVPFLPS